MNAKELLVKIKGLFVEDPAETAVGTTTATQTPFKTKDGKDLMIGIDDPTISPLPDAGDMVTIGGTAAPAGDYELEDGSTITVDATGVITLYTPAAPITQTPEQMAAAEAARTAAANAAAAAASGAAAQPQSVSQFSTELPTIERVTQDFNAMLAKFATGTPEERIANLEIVAKALMESCFGWQIREAQQKAAADQAIAIYKQDLTTSQAAVTAANAKLEKHGKTIEGMFELMEKIVNEPAVDPKTLTGGKKDSFASKKEAAIERTAQAIKDLKK